MIKANTEGSGVYILPSPHAYRPDLPKEEQEKTAEAGRRKWLKVLAEEVIHIHSTQQSRT